MSSTQSKTVFSPSGVAINTSVIDESLKKIMEEWRAKADTAADETEEGIPDSSPVLDEGSDEEAFPDGTSLAATATLNHKRPVHADAQQVSKKPRREDQGNPLTLNRSKGLLPSATIIPDGVSTGVEKDILKACATICHQLYKSKSFAALNLPSTVTPLYFEDHGIFKDTVPTFAITSCGKSLILAWRGSTSAVDWTSNLAYAPVLSSRWYAIAPNLRVHSSYNSLVESDLELYQDRIIKTISEKNIEEIIFTGHSLGGGLANVAHLIVKSQLEQERTPWRTRCPKGLTCRTVAFSAPMTTLNLESKQIGAFDPATPTNVFLRKVSDKTCNIIYSYDPVPHAVGDLMFLVETLTNILPDLIKIPCGQVVLGLFGVHDKIEDFLKTNLYPLLDNHHLGKIIFFNKANAQPLILCDSKFLTETPNLRGKNIIPKPPDGNGSVQKVIDAHMFFPVALVDMQYHLSNKGNAEENRP
jgi:hypothetical protein